MKSFILVFCLVLVSVYGYPADFADLEDSDEEYEEKPIAIFNPFNSFRSRVKFNPSAVSVDVGDSGEDSYFPSIFRPVFVNPFAGINLRDLFARPSWVDSMTPKTNPWTKVKNATSSTKVVDGHKIIHNDTTYEDEKSGAVFRFQVVEISPVDSKETGEKPEIDVKSGSEEKPIKPEQEDSNETPEDVSSPKPDNNSHDNEINREELEEDIEHERLTTTEPAIEIFNVDNIEQEEDIQKIVDLSGDIKVNQIMSDQAQQLIRLPPDVELFDVPEISEDVAQKLQEPDFQEAEVVEIEERPAVFGSHVEEMN